MNTEQKKMLDIQNRGSRVEKCLSLGCKGNDGKGHCLRDRIIISERGECTEEKI